jgi:hypothetical protein
MMIFIHYLVTEKMNMKDKFNILLYTQLVVVSALTVIECVMKFTLY